MLLLSRQFFFRHADAAICRTVTVAATSTPLYMLLFIDAAAAADAFSHAYAAAVTASRRPSAHQIYADAALLMPMPRDTASRHGAATYAIDISLRHFLAIAAAI